MPSDIRENIWELKDILKNIDEALEDAILYNRPFTDFEERCIRKGRDEINQALISLRETAGG